MALEFQVLQFPLASGVDEGTDPKGMPPGTLTSLSNLAWTKDGRLDKRYGVTALSTTGGPTTAARLFTRGDELCLVDGTSLYSYAPSASAWRAVGQVPDVGLTWSTLLESSSGVSAVDTAVSAGGLLVHAWVSGDPSIDPPDGTLVVQVIDAASGAQIIAPRTLHLNPVHHPRVVVLGTKAFVVARVGANVTAYAIDLSTLTIAAGVDLATDASTSSGLDACAIGSDIVICYVNNSGATCKLRSFDAALTAVTSATVEAGAGDIAVSIAGAAGEVLYVLYLSSAGLLRLAIHDATSLVQRVAPQTIEDLISVNGCEQLAVCRYDATHAVVSYTCLTTLYTDPRRTMSVLVDQTGSVSTTSTRGTWGTRLLARPFMLGSKCYAFALDNATTDIATGFNDTNSVLLELATSAVSVTPPSGSYVPHRYVGKVDVLIAGETARGSLPNVTPGTISGEMLAALPFLAVAPVTPTGWLCGTRLVRATTGSAMPADMWRSESLAQESYFAGGILAAYDGRSVFDFGFLRSPVWFTPVVNTGAIVKGSYVYAVTLEYRSAAGMTHRGPVTNQAQAFVLVGGSSADIIVDGVNVGNKGAAPLLATYRSTVDSAGIPQRLTVEPLYNLASVDVTAPYSGLTDASADVDIGGGLALASRPALYTVGGELEDFAPPSTITLHKHKGRLFAVTGDQRSIWFSKDSGSNIGTAPGFNPSMQLNYDSNVQALATLNDALVVFFSHSISVVGGSGPSPDGNNSDFDGAKTQAPFGCSDPRSVVSMSAGVVFRAPRGFYVLTPKFDVMWIGKPVQDQLAAFPIITSAVLVAELNQVRWTCNAADGLSGVVLAYDYERGQWSTYSYLGGAPIADACIWRGKWTFATSSGDVYAEDSTTYLDAGAYVPASFTTAWIAAAGPLGYQRMAKMAVVGDRYTDCDVTVQLGSNWQTTWDDAFTFNSTALAALADANIGAGVRVQLAPSHRLRVSDAAPTGVGAVLGNGRGLNLSALGLEVGVHSGMDRRAAARRK